MIVTIPIEPGVTLRCYPDRRFKQGCLSFQLVRPMVREEAAMNALIPAVLLRGTRNYPDLRAITQKLDTLYGAAISPIVRRVGDYQSFGLVCGFMDDRFALPGDAVLSPVLTFLRELLLDSPLKDGAFLPEFVESEKKNQISAIESELNDKRLYTIDKLIRHLCRDDSYSLSRMGETEEIAAITPQGLYSHWQSVLRTSPVEIFYVGSADPQTVAEHIRPIFEGLPRSPLTLAPQTGLLSPNSGDITEVLEVTQGKLCMGFTTPVTNRDDRFAAMQVLNVLYGGGMTSKLFQNVREKQSLCYSIHSGFYSSKGMLLVSAGIDFDKEAQTREGIFRQLQDCREGKISGEELTAARQALISSLRAAHDSPGAIEGYYLTGFLSGKPLTVPEHIALLEAVTREQVIAAANTLQYTASCFLKGVEA